MNLIGVLQLAKILGVMKRCSPKGTYAAWIAESNAWCCALATAPTPGITGIELPVYPLKGYSLTAPINAGYRAPEVSITDYEWLNPGHGALVFTLACGSTERLARMLG